MGNNMYKVLAILLLCFIQSSCFFVAGAAAGAAAIAIVYDHRTFANALEDTKIANNIVYKIQKISFLKNESHINVTVFNRIVLLTGETPNPDWREKASNIAQEVPGVIRVYNQLTLQGPTSSLTHTSDAWITTKIKSQMLAVEDLKSTSIKVVTENGVVYLMGVVKHQQAETVVDIARQVSGVQRVIKIFQYRD
jgi:osmotically-inducible protein OsmY